MFPVKTSNIASLIVLGTLCSGSNLFWFTEPRNKMLTSNKANEFNYCGRPSTRRYGMRIVNGVAASRNEYPWIAKLLVDYLTVGAGSLITDRHILTAAHCLIFYNERAFTETMHMYDCTGRGNVSAPLLPHCPESGSINKNYEALPVTFFSFILGSYATVNLPSDKVHQTLSYVIHPHFDIFKSSSDIIQVNDIAIVTIAPVTFSNKILPICLPLPNEAIPNWWNVTVAGWGTVTDYGDVPYQKQSLRSVVLMKTSLTHIPFEYCRTYTNISQFLTRRNCISPWEREIICLYADNTDSCRGDSGGPVMSKQFTNFYTVAGIVSWGIGCNRKNTPSAYTNVRTYFHWILMHTKNGFYLPRPPPQLNSPTFAYG